VLDNPTLEHPQDTRAIQHYLGHKNIENTARYTELASDRFDGFWSDADLLFDWLSDQAHPEPPIEHSRELRTLDSLSAQLIRRPATPPPWHPASATSPPESCDPARST
jgi:hypothetical protein